MCTGHPSGFPSTIFLFYRSVSISTPTVSDTASVFDCNSDSDCGISKCPKVLLQTFPTYFVSVWVIFNWLLVFLERLYALKIVLPISGQLTLSLSICFYLVLAHNNVFNEHLSVFVKALKISLQGLNGYYANCIGYFIWELDDILDCP